MGVKQPLDGRHADVRKVNRPDQYAAGSYWVEDLEGGSQRRDGPALHVRVLDHCALAIRERAPSAGGTWSDHDYARSHLESLEHFENAHDEGRTAEVEQGLGGAHPPRLATCQDDTRYGHVISLPTSCGSTPICHICAVASRRIRLLGDPVLRVRAQPVQAPISPATRLVADDLRDSLRIARKRHGMGRAIAAPQIGAPVRVILIDTDRKRTTMLNPEIVDVGPDDFTVWDDCFCFPDLLVRVTRAHLVSVRYLDPRGKEQVVQVEGPMAELVQHEIDHLDGILALDRAAGLDPFAYRAEWEEHHPPAERYGPPTPRQFL